MNDYLEKKFAGLSDAYKALFVRTIKSNIQKFVEVAIQEEMRNSWVNGCDEYDGEGDLFAANYTAYRFVTDTRGYVSLQFDYDWVVINSGTRSIVAQGKDKDYVGPDAENIDELLWCLACYIPDYMPHYADDPMEDNTIYRAFGKALKEDK